MRALAFQELNPMIIPPDILKRIFHKIEEGIKSNARLKLCEDPETNVTNTNCICPRYTGESTRHLSGPS